MINAVNGRIVSLGTDSMIVLAPSGVEYILECSQNTIRHFASLPQSEKDSSRVLAYLQHREDAMTLFGFYSEEERICFTELQTVPGIGAKQAIRILSGISVRDLIVALDQQDVKRLSKVPGIGPKTAQKLVLQLRNVLVLEEEGEEKQPQTSTVRQFADLIDSLCEMGYDRKYIVKALDGVLSENALLVEGKSTHEIEALVFPMLLRRLG